MVGRLYWDLTGSVLDSRKPIGLEKAIKRKLPSPAREAGCPIPSPLSPIPYSLFIYFSYFGLSERRTPDYRRPQPCRMTGQN